MFNFKQVYSNLCITLYLVKKSSNMYFNKLVICDVIFLNDTIFLSQDLEQKNMPTNLWNNLEFLLAPLCSKLPLFLFLLV